MITKEQIDDLSELYQIDGFTIAREYLQLVFLSYLYGARQGSNVYFKGGTALRFLFDSPRFSEDLDFSTTYTKEQIVEIITSLEQKMKKELPGLRIVGAYSGERGIRFRLKYQSADFKYPSVIRLDFNTVKQIRDKAVSPLLTKFPVMIFPLISHLSGEEILAEKIRALATRAKGRDFFDVWFMLKKGILLKENLLKLKFEEVGKVYGKEALLKKIKSYPQNKLDRDLSRFLPKSQRQITSLLKAGLTGLFEKMVGLKD